jgi:hypothetical protein
MCSDEVLLSFSNLILDLAYEALACMVGMRQRFEIPTAI